MPTLLGLPAALVLSEPAERCFHCAEALPQGAPQVPIDGALRSVCCAGCGVAAVWIRDAGLQDYYRLRQSAAPRVAAERDDYTAWEHPEVLAEHARAVPGGMEITVLTAEMRCAACAWLIDQALSRLHGVLEVSANAVTGRICLRWDPQRVRLSSALAQLAALGFVPHLASGMRQEQARRSTRNSQLLRLGVAGIGAMQAMMYSEALYLDFAGQMPLATRDFLRWIALLVSTPVVFYAGAPMLSGMLRELRARSLGMDTLVGSSILLAYFASLAETLRGGVHVWFDAAVMFVFLQLTARQLEAWARQRASAQVDALARARPALARRELADGSTEQIPLAALLPGDLLRVAVGEAVPADGELLDAAGSVDESLLTGESAPVNKARGASVLAGSSCRESPLRLRVLRTGQQTRLADLVRLVERAQASRPRMAQLADRVASLFVVALFGIAAGVALVWWQVDPTRAVAVTLAVLVVSCPCALSWAIPTALATSYGTLARIGVLTLRPDALAALASIDRVLLDKTGTLTCGKPQLLSSEAFAPLNLANALAIAAALQRDSGHPLAGAFAAGAKPALIAEAVQVIAGLGVQGRCDGRTYRLGRADFACAGVDDGAIWLGDGQRALARFTLQDTQRADAAAATCELQRLQLAPELSSGDAEPVVAALAQTLRLQMFRARQSPQDKLARVRELQAQGHRVLMLGDGINDAPVLAGADVSIAMASGAALAHRAADFVVVGETLRRVPQAVDLARRTRHIIRQNLTWAIAYNLVALPLAALGLVAPWLAALGMALSSLAVTLNALRLARMPA